MWYVLTSNPSNPTGKGGELLGGRAQAASRDVKLRPHLFPELAGYEKSLYIDANVLVTHSPRTLFDLVGDKASGVDFAAFDVSQTVYM